MEQEQTFDLRAYLDGEFPGFSFGGGVLDQWTLGLKFDIGLEHLDRVVKIFEQAFGEASELILIGEDWLWDSDPDRWYSLFSLPGLIRSSSLPHLTIWQPVQVIDDDLFTITWAALSPSGLAAERLITQLLTRIMAALHL